jgi:hypothetical protein
MQVGPCSVAVVVVHWSVQEDVQDDSHSVVAVVEHELSHPA